MLILQQLAFIKRLHVYILLSLPRELACMAGKRIRDATRATHVPYASSQSIPVDI